MTEAGTKSLLSLSFICANKLAVTLSAIDARVCTESFRFKMECCVHCRLWFVTRLWGSGSDTEICFLKSRVFKERVRLICELDLKVGFGGVTSLVGLVLD